MENMINRAQSIFENTAGNIYDVYYIVLKECILTAEDPSDIFGQVLMKSQEYKFSDDQNSEYFTEDYVDDIIGIYGKLLEECVKIIVCENLALDEFYRKLYAYVFELGIFPEDVKVRAILLYYLAEKSSGIPYFQMPELPKIDRETYKNVVEKLSPQIDKVFFVLNRNFKSRPEEASQIFEIMEELDKKEDKIVFLSVLINIIQKYEEDSN